MPEPLWLKPVLLPPKPAVAPGVGFVKTFSASAAVVVTA